MNREKIEYALADTAVKATIGACRGIGKVANSRFMNSKVARGAGDFLLGATIAALVLCNPVYAEGGDTSGATKAMDEMVDTILSVVQKVGAVVVVFGAINAGIGIANQDDAGRNRGFMTMAGGAVVGLVATGAKTWAGMGGS